MFLLGWSFAELVLEAGPSARAAEGGEAISSRVAKIAFYLHIGNAVQPAGAVTRLNAERRYAVFDDERVRTVTTDSAFQLIVRRAELRPLLSVP